MANGVGVFNTATVASATGATITDVDGKEWIKTIQDHYITKDPDNKNEVEEEIAEMAGFKLM